MLLETGQIAGHGILDIDERFGAGLALRNTARQRRTLGYKHAVLIRLNHHSVFHRINLKAPPAKVNRSPTVRPRPARSKSIPGCPTWPHEHFSSRLAFPLAALSFNCDC